MSLTADIYKTLNMWCDRRIRVPVIPHNLDFKESPSYVEVSSLNCDLREIALPILAALRRYSEIEKDMLWCIKNSGQLEWSRETKSELLQKYFPEEIKNLPYYMGGTKTYNEANEP